MDAPGRSHPRGHRARHQVLRPHRATPLGSGQQPQEHHAGDRRLVAATRNRLRRSVSDPFLRPERAHRRDPPGDGRSRALRQGALHRLFEHARLPTRPFDRTQRTAAHQPIRKCAAALQPAVPRDRARAAAAVRRGERSGDPLQPVGWRDAHRQAPPRGADRGHTVHARTGPGQLHRSLLARCDVRLGRADPDCRRRCRRSDDHPGAAMGARQPGDHVTDHRRQSPRTTGCLGGGRRSPARSGRQAHGSTRSPLSTARATTTADVQPQRTRNRPVGHLTGGRR